MLETSGSISYGVSYLVSELVIVVNDYITRAFLT